MTLSPGEILARAQVLAVVNMLNPPLPPEDTEAMRAAIHDAAKDRPWRAAWLILGMLASEIAPGIAIAEAVRNANPNGRPHKGPPDDEVRRMVQDELNRSAPSRKELGNARRAVFDALRARERKGLAELRARTRAPDLTAADLPHGLQHISMKEIARRSRGVTRT